MIKFCQKQILLVKKACILHKIHSHSHLILDPESAFYDHFRGSEAPSEVVVVCRSRIQDQVAVAVDFMQNIRTLGLKFLYLTKIEVLMPHHALYYRRGLFFPPCTCVHKLLTPASHCTSFDRGSVNSHYIKNTNCSASRFKRYFLVKAIDTPSVKAGAVICWSQQLMYTSTWWKKIHEDISGNHLTPIQDYMI